ncbi:RidA family protein [Listeria monocytogenes]|uniref:2-iminobutanoate/2-iminopropanoate deaminase n=2 Tax=Listeria monocytogenes TaxID=1639 RepID=A0A1T1YQE6_LISMN|nr:MULTISPECIES: RidA family protein [Listeria]EAE1680054.1 RidA family protein [Listeria monocytogenes LIS0071]EAE3704493.1 RidA family protein [Listeria monocytogenes serotype 1/2b]EAF3077082.1 RidA family protein [Listeria monocytogenes serotype 1/2a]EAG6252017.1 RidA family protein [Listeria monocytogenes CFSAN003806]EAG6261366.1 RidA family protein [Listeria monocytogenes CFSAN003725]EAG6331064.1 RidA family protein [Listeria monocytogenes CFSAN002346]EAG6350920.1 RidA family protein [L
MAKEIIQTSSAPKALGPYSQAVKVNGLIFTSGQLGINPETGELADGTTKQAEQAFKNIAAVLAEAGSGLDKIIKATVFFKDLNEFKAVNEVYATFFSSDFPARSAFQVAKLPLDAAIEIEVIAEA